MFQPLIFRGVTATDLSFFTTPPETHFQNITEMTWQSKKPGFVSFAQESIYDLLIKGIYPLVNSNISMDHPHSQYKIHIVFKSSIFSVAMLVYQSLAGIFFVILHPGFIYRKHQLLEIHSERCARADPSPLQEQHANIATTCSDESWTPEG